MRNRFPGPCKDCGAVVPAGEGYFERQHATRSWAVRHVRCTAIAKADAGKSLTLAQRQALSSPDTTGANRGQ